ncbi:hypothetical protein [uncultured Odoribacter sp.]|uniref:hypothetical protein n=1 Tax=uncultured Odoribacter sp. TaxID=876416 RepID=UPI00260FAF3B|nr:hypothetical protein [uncultured Odoribacter sp.]
MKEADIKGRLELLKAVFQNLKDISLKDISWKFLESEKGSCLSPRSQTELLMLNFIEGKISEEDCWEILCELGEREGILFLAPLLGRRKFLKLKEALKNRDYTLFIKTINGDNLIKLKVIIYEWKLTRGPIQKIQQYLANLSIKQSIEDLELIAPHIISIFDEYQRKKTNELEELKKKSEEEKVRWLQKIIYSLYYAIFYFLNNNMPFKVQNSIITLLKESPYSWELQELYNEFMRENGNAKDWIICIKNHEQIQVPTIILPEYYNEEKDKLSEKRSLHLDLNKKQIEFLFQSLLDQKYISDASDIIRFAFFLTGEKPKDYDNFEKIEWLGGLQDLACFIGLLCPISEDIKSGTWERTAETFVRESKAVSSDNKNIFNEISSKGLASSFKRIENKYREKEEYKNDTYEYFKNLIMEMKKIF